MPDSVKNRITKGVNALDLSLTESQIDLLEAYLNLLMKWNKAFNLSAIRNIDEAVDKHLIDSLSLVPEMIAGKRYLDIGAGAGLPGIPLAIACPEITVTMVDSNGKKTRFIQQVISQLSINNAAVIQSRIEAIPEVEFDVVMARALGTLAQMLSWLGDKFTDSHQMLAMKGVFPEEELSALPSHYKVNDIKALSVPGIDAERHLVWLSR